MHSQVINYIKQRIEISREEIEESLKYSDFKKYKKVIIYYEPVNTAVLLVF
jgi:hypothetical protein